MKKTIFMLPALALMLFAACSSEDAVTKDNTAQLNETSESAIGFDAYLTRTTTRAGWPGAMTTSSGERNLRTEGFGVFAYYADGDLYSENAIPDFMYNQKVEYRTIISAWTYEPIKYWPNEFGSSAVSTGVDRVTFFAYAPYVAVDPATGQLTSSYDDDPNDVSKSTQTGITALTRNGKTGDPYVRYVGAFTPDDCVDLLYGVAAEDFTSKVGAADGANNIKKGDPFINVAKPEIGAKLKFDFKHALTKLKVYVDADVDILDHQNGANDPDKVEGNTRIWIRSITFDGIAQRGYLNLNNGMWYEVMGGNKISHANVTIHDGQRDGAEAVAKDEYEAPTGLNPNLVQSGAYNTDVAPGTSFPYTTVTTTPNGVTSAYQPLFGETSHDLMVIPANEQLKVTIVYDVETADATLPNYLSDGVTKGSTVENRITKAITMGGTALKLDAGKEYTLNLHLGMTSVKFDAQVSDWTDGGTADDTWLPINGPTHAAAKPAAPVSVTINAEAQTYEFAISGLNSGEAVTTDPSTVADPLSNATTNAANASGLAVESIDIAENKSVSDITHSVTWKGATSEKGVALTITQKAHALGLGVQAFNASTKTITLKKEAKDGWSAIITAPANTDNLLIKKNGAALVASTDFTFASGIITLTDAPKAGDVFTITVKALETGVPLVKTADAETITVRVGGPVLSNAAQTIEYGETYTRLPDFIGPTTTTPTYSWDTSDGTKATVANGIVTTVHAGDATISVKQTAPTVTADGWVYDNNEKEYNVTVTKAAGTISFTNPDQASPAAFALGNYDEGDVIINDNPAVLKNSKGTVLTTGSIGTVSYSVSDGTYFQIDTDGTLKFKGTWNAGDPHEVTVTATVNDGTATDAGYAVKTASYKITVKAANP